MPDFRTRRNEERSGSSRAASLKTSGSSQLFGRAASSAMARRRMTMKRSFAFFAVALCQTMLCACASAPRIPFTNADQMAAVPTDARNIRILG